MKLKQQTKHILMGGLLLFITGGVMAQSADRNYIRVITPQRGIKSESGLTMLSQNKDSVMTEIKYFDGLGRPSQTVQVKGNADGTKDIVQPVEYDQFGREVRKYLPFASGEAANGSFRVNAVSQQSAFYNPAGSSGTQQGNGVVRNTSPYAISVPEASPLGRIMEQGAPGAAWQPGTGHTTRMDYLFNNQQVFTTTPVANNPGSRRAVLYQVNASGALIRNATDAYYKSNELYVTVTRDENWQATDGCAGTVETYKDKEDRMVLKRTYNKSETAVMMLSTYYVYDDYGNLSYVLPPGSNPDRASGIPSQSELNNFAYQYKYDERNRLSEKKIPGRDWDYMVYNQLDQLVISQDGNQRMKTPLQEAFYTKYDSLGRVAMTGIFSIPGSSVAGQSYRSVLVNAVNNQAKQAENRLYAGSAGTTDYSSNCYPTSGGTTLTVNYYDDYTNIPDKQTYFIPASYSRKTKGLLTGTRVAILNNPAVMLKSFMYYDDKGRQTVFYKQHFKGGSSLVRNHDAYYTKYSFTGLIDSTRREHYINDGVSTLPAHKLRVTNEYAYDHMGRKTKSWMQITNDGQTPDSRKLISQQLYNEIGQLKTKRLHSTDEGQTFLQDLNYKYNERGWLKNQEAGLFSFQLNYNDGANAQFNGNISEQVWINPGNPSRTYAYSYDKLNRLLSGGSNEGHNEQVTYDAMGNISRLKRYRAGGVLLDDMIYDYMLNGTAGNQLQSLNDLSSNTDLGTMPNGNKVFSYDNNGNLKTDPSKDITGITYNLLNLPQSVTRSQGSSIYSYSASGEKLRRQAGGVSTEYIGGLQYSGNTVDFIQTEEGRAIPKDASTYNYEYTISDHLGNSRVGFDTRNGTANVVQTNNYYPFGMGWLDAGQLVSSPANNYLYNKKEKQDNLGGLYDYGARFYDPIIARWATVDPLAEKYFGVTPYAYAANNPILIIDPDGRDIDLSKLTDDKNKEGLVKFWKTKNGQAYLASYLKSGQSISVKIGDKIYTLKNNGKDGKFASDVLAFGSAKYLGSADGKRDLGVTDLKKVDGTELNSNEYGDQTPEFDVSNNKVVHQIWLAEDMSADQAASTIGHEAFVHDQPNQEMLIDLRRQLNNGNIKPGTPEYAQKLDVLNYNGNDDHKKLANGQVGTYRNYSMQLDQIQKTTKFIQSYNQDVKNHAKDK